MKSFLVFSLFALSLFQLSCGKKPGTTEPPVTIDETYQLIVFGAEFCTFCKTQLPEIQEGLRSLLANQKSGLTGKTIVPAGKAPTIKPTPEIVTKYCADHGLNDLLPCVADDKWKNFEKYIQKDHNLPGAVVLNSKGEPLRSWKPGVATFVPSEIIAYVKGLIRNK